MTWGPDENNPGWVVPRTSAWTPTEQERPRQNAAVEWISPGGAVERGRYLGGAVWMPAGSAIDVSYTPTFWRYVEGEKEGEKVE